MIDDDFVEGKTGRVTLNNVNLATVKAILKFIYTGKVDMALEDKELENLFKAAHLCMLDGLVNFCVASLIAGVTTTNAVQMMALGHTYGVVELKEKAKKTFLQAG